MPLSYDRSLCELIVSTPLQSPKTAVDGAFERLRHRIPIVCCYKCVICHSIIVGLALRICLPLSHESPNTLNPVDEKHSFLVILPH